MRIKQLGHPILREQSQAISEQDISSKRVQDTLSFMKETLDGIKAISDENGNALSAPQVGQAIRMVLLRLDGDFVPMINPELIETSETLFEFEEECFSFYNLRGLTQRHAQVKVKYLDEEGTEHKISLSGEEAGLIQHEIDHLNGVFFTDRVEDKQSLRSIDYIFKDKPSRLKVVKDMAEYMAQ
ncbi:peptide deformylase [Ningiella sp. W23]|uniref:peptide deformylase n=1 Tax=Ningiella sp. W23 TaxID=3023715 RepID=UPI0037575D87